MQIVKTALLVIFILLSLATGAVKLFGLPADIEVFSSLGFSAAATFWFGVVQVLGGLLLIYLPTRRLGASIILITFLFATLALFVSGNTAFGWFSILFVLLALVPLLPHASQRSYHQEVNNDPA